MKFVLVAGASGYLGRHVVAELKRQGHRVRALVRQRDPLWKRSEQLAPAVGAEVDEIIVGDLTQPASLQGICHQIQCVISCAGLSVKDANRLTPEQVDYHGNRNLLIEAIKAGSVEKFIYVSMFPRQQEPDPVQLAKEKFVKDLQESVMTSYIVRPTLFYSELLPLLFTAHAGHIWLPGDSSHKLNPIHGRDLAEACIKGMIAKEKELSIGGPEILSLDEICRLAFKAQNKPARVLPIPGPLSGLARAWLQLLGRRQLASFEFLRAEGLRTGLPAAQGQQQLENYFKQYLESPFFRP